MRSGRAESLVVMVVIGISRGDAIPSFLGQSAEAQDASAKTNVRTVSDAKTDGKSHVFRWVQTARGIKQQVCVKGDLTALDAGGCRNSRW